MSDGTLFKPDKDYTKDVDELVPQAQELAKVCPDYQVITIEANPSSTVRYPCRSREAPRARKAS